MTLQNEIIEHLESLDDLRCLCTSMKYICGKDPFPCISFIYHGTSFVFEVKQNDKPLSSQQENALFQLNRDGWNVAVIRSIQQAKQILESI